MTRPSCSMPVTAGVPPNHHHQINMRLLRDLEHNHWDTVQSIIKVNQTYPQEMWNRVNNSSLIYSLIHLNCLKTTTLLLAGMEVALRVMVTLTTPVRWIDRQRTALTWWTPIYTPEARTLRKGLRTADCLWLEILGGKIYIMWCFILLTHYVVNERCT